MTTLRHPTAIIEPGAEVHPSVRIGAYSIIDEGAVIGADCVIETGARIYGLTRMGIGNRVCHGAAIGAEPQDLSYDRARAKPLVIGDYNQFREGVNISHGIKEDHGTRLGSHNYLMVNAHIGHDCVLGDYNVFVNNGMIAGHVVVGDRAFISGHSAVHQFCQVGSYAMVAAVSGVPRDVPPFALVDGHRAEIIGLNLVGLKRAGFDQARRSAIKQAYKVIFKQGLKTADALQQLRASWPDNPDIAELCRFIAASTRGLLPHR